MYVRHLAWLNTAPDKPEGDKSDRREVPRREALEKEKGDELEMPECAAGYLIGYLFEVGPVASGGMGEAPISHGEIESWVRNTGIPLTSWEARMLKHLSVQYLSQSQKSTARDCPCPWADAPYGKSVVNLKAERTRDALRALASL